MITSLKPPKVEKQITMKDGKETLVKFIVLAGGITTEDYTAATRALRRAVIAYTDSLTVPYITFAGIDNPFVSLVLQDNNL
jgi:hypothetical protein